MKPSSFYLHFRFFFSLALSSFASFISFGLTMFKPCLTTQSTFPVQIVDSILDTLWIPNETISLANFPIFTCEWIKIKDYNWIPDGNTWVYISERTMVH